MKRTNLRILTTQTLALSLLMGPALAQAPQYPQSPQTDPSKLERVPLLKPGADDKMPGQLPDPTVKVPTTSGEAVGPEIKPEVKKETESASQSVLNNESKLEQKIEDDFKAPERTSTSLSVPTLHTPASKSSTSAPVKPGASKEPMKLFGRIEQLTGSADVKLPPLKALTPQLDPRGLVGGVSGAVDESKYSGTIAKEFPNEFKGTWGGTLKVWTYTYSPLYLKQDPAEAASMVKIMKRDRAGVTNFVFREDRTRKISLEPTSVLLSVPMKDTNTYAQMMKGGGPGNMGAFAGQFEQIMGNMETPCVAVHFDNYRADGVTETGVSGNKSAGQVVKNVLRQLAPGVVEQQIVSKFTTIVKGTNKKNTGYSESVIRFKKLSAGQLYVLAASVNYSDKGQYLNKFIMYGTVDHNRVMETNPMSSMSKMIPGLGPDMMNNPALRNMFGAGGASPNFDPSKLPSNMMPKNGQMPGMPGMNGGMPGGLDFNELMKRMNGN